MLFECSPIYLSGKEYKDNLGAHLKRPEVARAFYQQLLTRDLSKYSDSFQHSRPITDCYRAAQQNSIPVISRFSLLINGDCPESLIGSESCAPCSATCPLVFKPAPCPHTLTRPGQAGREPDPSPRATGSAIRASISTTGRCASPARLGQETPGLNRTCRRIRTVTGRAWTPASRPSTLHDGRMQVGMRCLACDGLPALLPVFLRGRGRAFWD